MPFKNAGITATTVETFQRCEQALERLNSMIQTMNGKEISVKIAPCILGTGITITPTFGKIDALRIRPSAKDEFWVDYEVEKKYISIRAADSEIYTIHLEAPKNA